MSRHTWALIAIDEYGSEWKWCIRCGTATHRGFVYEHGGHQKKTLVAASSTTCPYKKQEDVPADIQERVDALNNTSGHMDLDEMVHDIKGGEAADVNNGGVKAQIQYLHDMGMSWNDIRVPLELEKKE